MQDTRKSILDYLREHGQAAVEPLADHCGLAAVTVRHHLSVLRERGLVEVEHESVGRGRPRHVYRLSPRGGEEVVEDRYREMADRLLEAMKAGSRESAERFFRDMAERLLGDRAEALRARPIAERLDVFGALLSEEGFTVRWERDGDDFIVREVACPYQGLGATHDEVCCMDRHLLESLVDGRVVREQWRLEGDAECVFRVLPAETVSERA
jgi:DeoR family suf operon transcriptional repressor